MGRVSESQGQKVPHKIPRSHWKKVDRTRAFSEIPFRSPGRNEARRRNKSDYKQVKPLALRR